MSCIQLSEYLTSSYRKFKWTTAIKVQFNKANTLLMVSGVLKVTINKARRVDKCDQRKLLLLGGRDLGGEIVDHTRHGLEGLEVRIEVEGGIASEGLSPPA